MITKFENFFDEQLFHECVDYARELLKDESKLYKTDTAWERVVVNLNPILRHVIEAPLATRIIEQIKAKASLEKFKVTPLLYFYKPGSHIGWHNDDHLHATVTHYLNDEWDASNGGLFLYKIDDEIRGIVPKRNLAVLQTEATPHAVSRLTSNAPIRIAIHSFVEAQ